MSKIKYTTIRDPQWGRCGYDLELYVAPRADKNPTLLLKGGLGDAGSHTLKPVRDAVIELTDGEMSVGTVGTIRPFSFLESKRIICSPEEESRARKQRMQSMLRALNSTKPLTNSSSILLGGQSQGGVTVVDTALYASRKNHSSNQDPRLAVATIDSPGVYQKLGYEGIPFRGLLELLQHCIPSLRRDLSIREQLQLFTDNIKNPRLVLELPYLLGEIKYLKSVGLFQEIATLRAGGLAVGHVFHDQDIVEGAIDSKHDPHALVFPGTHVTFMSEPEPVAQVLVNMAYELHDNPSTAFDLSSYQRAA